MGSNILRRVILEGNSSWVKWGKFILSWQLPPQLPLSFVSGKSFPAVIALEWGCKYPLGNLSSLIIALGSNLSQEYFSLWQLSFPKRNCPLGWFFRSHFASGRQYTAVVNENSVLILNNKRKARWIRSSNKVKQTLRKSRIWHKVNFLAEFNCFEFRVFLLLERLPIPKFKSTGCPTIYP